MISVDSRQLRNNCDIVELWRSTPPTKRSSIAYSSSALCAQAYNETCRALMTDPLGEILFSDIRKDILAGYHNLGVFGTPRAKRGVTKAQSRGSLHISLLIWLRNSPIFWARKFYGLEAREKLRKYIDDTVLGALSKEHHDEMAAGKPVTTVLDKPPAIIRGIEKRGRVVVTTSNIHEHRVPNVDVVKLARPSAPSLGPVIL